jgi:hypothetical protein
MALGKRTALDERVGRTPLLLRYSVASAAVSSVTPSRRASEARIAATRALNRFFSHLPNRIQIVQCVELYWRAVVEFIGGLLISALGHERRSPWPLPISALRSRSARPEPHCILQDARLVSAYPKCAASISSAARRIPRAPSALRADQLSLALANWPIGHASWCYSPRAVVVVLARRHLLDPCVGGKQAALLLRIDADRRLPGQRANSVQHVLRSDPGVLVARCS